MRPDAGVVFNLDPETVEKAYEALLPHAPGHQSHQRRAPPASTAKEEEEPSGE